MKNTLVFLNVEGIGLNSNLKGNYFKLINKPNLNYLISGIFPWSIITNEYKGKSKYSLNNHYVSKDIDKNFYQTILGSKDILTTKEKMQKVFDDKTLLNLDIFTKIKDHCIKNNSCCHLFFMLSSNTFHIDKNHIKLVINALVINKVKIVLHVIADGKDCIPFTFYEELLSFFKFLTKRKIPIASIAGRDNVFTKMGLNHYDNKHIDNYFNNIVGLSKNFFDSPIMYAEENLYNKIEDYKIEPAINKNIYKTFVEENDSILFLDYDNDVYSSLAYKFCNTEESKFKNIQISSFNKIYGIKNMNTFFDQNNSFESIPKVLSNNDMNSLILSLPHKKGFIQKIYGYEKDKNIDLISIKIKDYKSIYDYIFWANKLLVDKTIKSIGKYNFITIHNPVIAEIAKTGDLDLLRFAVESFDKNLGRLINYLRATGNTLALASMYGSIEKMINNKFTLTPYNKKSPTFFVFSDGDVSSKSLHTNFCSIYSTILTSLGIKLDKLIKNSLITSNYDQSNMKNRYIADFEVWHKNVAVPLLNDFRENKLSLYNDLQREEKYLVEKQNYIVVNELIKIHEQYFTTSKSREKIYNYLLDYVSYNNIDFENFKYNISKYFMTMFDDDILLIKKSKSIFKFLENKYLIRKNKKANKWIAKIKYNSRLIRKREKLNKTYTNINSIIKKTFQPFFFFEKFFMAEEKIFESNNAGNIINFYESTKDDIKDVYETYFYQKIKMLIVDDNYDESEDEETNETDIKPDLFKIYSYMKIHEEILEIVKENKEKAALYDLKMQEKGFVNSKNTSIFELDISLINKILRLILPIYKTWKFDINLHKKNILSQNKHVSNNYNIKYSKKVKEQTELISYDGEFLENIDLFNQKRLEKKLIEKVNKINLFDTPSIDLINNSDDFLDREIFSSIQENPEEIVDKVDNIIIRPIYNKAEDWNKKRIEEIKNVEYISTNPFENIPDALREIQKSSNHEKIVKQYFENSKSWKRNSDISKNKIKQFSEINQNNLGE